jgi:hypothetical protein
MSPTTPDPTPDPMMAAAFQLDPPDSFVDPRTVEGFQPAYWPLYNEGEAPLASTADRHERRCIELLAAYYAVNCRQAELNATREAGSTPEEIAGHLAAVEAALQSVDKLEDRYAPVGFYGEPKMAGGFYRSIGFHRPELPRIFPQASSLSSHIGIPGFTDIPTDARIGPVITTRWP